MGLLVAGFSFLILLAISFTFFLSFYHLVSSPVSFINTQFILLNTFSSLENSEPKLPNTPSNTAQ
jgi:hypothetical protein